MPARRTRLRTESETTISASEEHGIQAAFAPDPHPANICPDYKSSLLRGPTQPLMPLRGAGLPERTGPSFGPGAVAPQTQDLTRPSARGAEALGERILVAGRVIDEAGRPVPRALLEIWQANAAGRYIHERDQHDAPLDPNFFGAGRFLTGADGSYCFKTIRPGAYPWGNHLNAWRPPHIHFSIFGAGLSTRLVTQMYFPGDPLLELDPIFTAVPGFARERLIAEFSLEVTEPGIALGYVFDIVLAGGLETPMEDRT